MGEQGIFPDTIKVELLNGEIIEMTPINSRHSGMVKRLNHLLGSIFSGRAIISIQDPVTLDSKSEPEPDVAVLKWRSDFYSASHPTPEEVILLIEVADSSLPKDQKIKIPLYAAAGISETWLINLEKSEIEVFTQPTAQGYAKSQIYHRGEIIQSEQVKELPVDDLFV